MKIYKFILIEGKNFHFGWMNFKIIQLILILIVIVIYNILIVINNYHMRKRVEERNSEQIRKRPRLVTLSTNNFYTGWIQTDSAINLSSTVIRKNLKDKNIEIDGKNIPKPCFEFKEMSLPRCILKALKHENFKKPTPIQSICLPVTLSGRNLICISTSGSGKTISFLLPTILHAIGQEIQLKLTNPKSFYCLLLSHSRELQKQTHKILQYLLKFVKKSRTLSLSLNTLV